MHVIVSQIFWPAWCLASERSDILVNEIKIKTKINSIQLTETKTKTEIIFKTKTK